jgi:hypothetical protein
MTMNPNSSVFWSNLDERADGAIDHSRHPATRLPQTVNEDHLKVIAWVKPSSPTRSLPNTQVNARIEHYWRKISC